MTTLDELHTVIQDLVNQIEEDGGDIKAAKVTCLITRDVERINVVRLSNDEILILPIVDEEEEY